MRESLQNYCDLFIANRDVVRDTFSMASNYLVPVSANMLTGKGITADAERLKACRKIIKENTGVFSSFRGNAELAMIIELAASEDPAQKFDRILKIYDTLKRDFYGSAYLTIVASVMADMMPTGDVTYYVTRGRNLYNRMKKEHPFLTSAEDSIFAVLMAFSEKNDDMLIDEMEKCYNRLRKSLGSEKNATQSLSHVLALVEGDWNAKCAKVENIFFGLQNAGRKYSRYYEVAVLGSAGIMEEEWTLLKDEILEVDAFLEGQKGYGGLLGLDKKTRLMNAAMIVVSERSDSVSRQNSSAAVLAGTLSMIAAQQAALVAIIAASSASAAASN